MLFILYRDTWSDTQFPLSLQFLSLFNLRIELFKNTLVTRSWYSSMGYGFNLICWYQFMVEISVQTCTFKIQRNSWKEGSCVLFPHVVAPYHATSKWAIFGVLCPGIIRPSCCKQSKVVPNYCQVGAPLVCPLFFYVVVVSDLVHALYYIVSFHWRAYLFVGLK